MKTIILLAMLVATPVSAATYTYEYVSQPLEYNGWDVWDQYSDYEFPSFETDEEYDEYYRNFDEEIANFPGYAPPITYRFVIDEAKQPGRTIAGKTLSFYCRFRSQIGQVCEGYDGAVFDEMNSNESFGSFAAWDYGFLELAADRSVMLFSREADDDPDYAYSRGGHDGLSEIYYSTVALRGLRLDYSSSRPGTWTVSMTPTPVPLPAGWPLLLGAGLMLGFIKHRGKDSRGQPMLV